MLGSNILLPMSINKETTFSIAKLTFGVIVVGCMITIVVQVSAVSAMFGEMRATVNFIREGLIETNKKVDTYIRSYEQEKKDTERRFQKLESKLSAID